MSVDLYPEQIGVPLAEVRTFRKMLGGSPTMWPWRPPGWDGGPA